MKLILVFCLFVSTACGNGNARFSNSKGRIKTKSTIENPNSDKKLDADAQTNPDNVEPEKPDHPGQDVIVEPEPVKDNVDPEESNEDPKPISFSFLGPEETKHQLKIQAEQKSQEIKMGREIEQVRRTKTLRQVSRDRVVKTFVQGAPDGQWSDTINQSESGVIDILLVIDNSRSMLEEQLKVGSNLSTLLSQISTTDWKIKIVSTDVNDSCQGKIVGSKDRDPEQKFYDAVLAAGIEGSTNEEGIRSAVQALECGDDWMRANSNLAVLIVSDEDNCSNGRCQGDERSKPEYFINLLASELGGSYRKVGDDARVYGVIFEPGDFSCQEGGFMGRVYEKLIKDTNGKIGSICAPSYSEIFSQISHDIRSTLRASFLLAHTPRPESMKVQVNGTSMERGRDFEVIEDSLVFKVPPPAWSKIVIKYSYANDPMHDHFDLGEQVGKIHSVTLESTNGETSTIDDDSFQIVGSQIEFTQMPEERATIRVDYRKNFPTLINGYHLSENLIPGSIEVEVEGKNVEYRYNDEDRTLKLVHTAQDGQNISFAYTDAMDLGPKYSYEYAAVDESVYHFRARDSETGEEIMVEGHQDGIVRFSDADYEIDRRITVDYFSSDFHKDPISLPPHAKPESIIVSIVKPGELEGVLCSDYTIDDATRQLQINCPVSFEDSVDIQYRSIERQRLVFTIDIVNSESFLWEVFVDQELDHSHTREGNVIRFDPSIPSQAKIKVVLHPR